MEVLDRYREPKPVVDRLQGYLARLRAGDITPEELVLRKRASKRTEAHRQGTHVVSALYRYQANGIERGPGQDVQYVVVDDEARLPDRVRLPFEEIEGYDVEIYTQEMIRAAEIIVSPMGWDRENIRRRLRDTTETTLQAFD